ncbi:hypothetical protein AgCh_037518 [Apium graveolens]
MKTAMASADATSKTGFKGYQMGTQNVSLGVVTLGICISVGVGMSTAFQHLAHSPGVNLSKKKRLTFPELDLSSEVMASAGKKYGICKKLGQLNYNFIGQQSNASSPNPYQMFMDRGSIEVDDVYAFSVTSDIIMNSDPEPQSMEECRHRDDWPKWKIAIQEELQSLRKRNVFGPAVQTPAGVVPVGNRWETYSPVMDGVTFRFLIGMACMEKLETRLMDVVTAYLYGSLDIDIYMKIPEGLNIEDTKPRHLYSVKLQRSLYGLKQSGRMCTTEDITNAVNYLKNEFAMKDLGRTRFCLGIQVEHLSSGIFVHQSNYTEKILDRFYMDKAHPLTIPMVVRSLEVEKDPFRLRKQDEETLGPEVPYLSAIGALMYLANNTRPDIAFAVNLLARFSSDPTKRHWDGIKHIFRYLRGTIDLGLFFPNNSRSLLVGYADAGYMSNPHFGRSQIGYLFTYCDSTISWKSTKQTMTATSSNHVELLAIHEASRECIWLRSVIQHIRESCGLSSISDSPTVLFEDNSTCIKQLKEGYIKGDRTKHILPKFFYPHELQENGDIDIQQVRSCDNLADMLTKSLPTSTFEKLRNNMGIYLTPFLHSHSLHINPNHPKKPFIASLSNPNAQLQQLLYEKSKVGFDKLDDALFVFDKMLKMKPLLPALNFSQLLAGLVRMKEYSVGVSMFRDMCVLCVPVNIFTYNTVINCCCHLNRLDYAFSLLGGSIKRGFVPDVVTYSTLIKGLLSQDRPVEAEHMFKKLILFNEVQPNVVTYSIIIDGLCKTSNTLMAVKLFRNMGKKGCIPDTVTYSTLIDALCKDRHVDHALSLLSAMNHKGISPNVVTYTSLIQGLCNFGRWEDAIQLLGEMNARNISPNVHTYNVLIDACCKEGKVKDAESVMELMIQRGQYPDVVTYNSLMDGYCLRGEIDEALEVLKTMRGKGILPNSCTYNILINGCCKKMEVDRAISLLKQMPLEGLVPTIETFSTILQGYFQAGRVVEARKFLQERMLNEGCKLDIVTFTIILHGLCENHLVGEALSFFHTMECAGVHPDIVIYTILIDGLSKDGRLEKARTLFESLPSKGLRPDVKAYTVMIGAFCREGFLDEANELFAKMKDSICLPNGATYNTLIRGCFCNMKYSEAIALIDEMHARGFSEDASTVSMLLVLLESKDQDPALLALRKNTRRCIQEVIAECRFCSPFRENLVLGVSNQSKLQPLNSHLPFRVRNVRCYLMHGKKFEDLELLSLLNFYRTGRKTRFGINNRLYEMWTF